MSRELRICARCDAFVPPTVAACPCCGTARRGLPGWVKTLGVLGGSGLMSLTLSACYGAPCAGGGCYETVPDPVPACDPSEDLDGDGHCGDQDCDDREPEVYVGAPELAGDGFDRDCDGVD